MKAPIKTIVEAFSKGNFEFVYPHFSNEIEWHIVGDKKITGKNNVIEFCNKMLIEIAGSQLNNTNVVVDDNTIAIEGYCHYSDAENKAMQVQYCDVYSFRDDKVEKITSYCISSPFSV